MTRNIPPTRLMYQAMREAAVAPDRRFPSTYTANTMAGLVAREIATFGSPHYLTRAGVDALRAHDPDAPIGLTAKERADLIALHERELHRTHPHLTLNYEETMRRYSLDPQGWALGFLEVPGVLIYGWACRECRGETPRYPAPEEAVRAALAHAHSHECGHNIALLAAEGHAVSPLDEEDTQEDDELVPGNVITHQGAGHGLEPEHADDPDACAAVRVLEAAGLPLADLPETYDPETSQANGYMVQPSGGGSEGETRVYYLTDGRISDPVTGDHPRADLRLAARALRAAGWEVETFIMACVRARQSGGYVSEAGAVAAPDVAYDPQKGWSVDGRSYGDDHVAAAVALDAHPGFVGDNAADVVMHAQLPALSGELPEGLEIRGGPERGYGFCCEIDGCGERVDGQCDWPSIAARVARSHYENRHETPRPATEGPWRARLIDQKWTVVVRATGEVVAVLGEGERARRDARFIVHARNRNEG